MSLHHGEAERVGIEAANSAVVEVRLEDDIGVRVQELEEGAVADQAAARAAAS